MKNYKHLLLLICNCVSLAMGVAVIVFYIMNIEVKEVLFMLSLGTVLQSIILLSMSLGKNKK